MTREYYEKHVRPNVKTGDLMLFRGKSLLAKTIQYFDDAKWNHIGVVFRTAGRFFIVDSNRRGVHPEFLSERCMDNVEVAVIRPRTAFHQEKQKAMCKLMSEADAGIKYDFSLLARIAIARKTGVDLAALGNEKKDICSEFARRYALKVGMTHYDNRPNWITPQDFVRMHNSQAAELIEFGKEADAQLR